MPVGDDYAAFSIISSGTVITPSDFDGGIIRRKITDKETAWFKKVFDVAVRMRPFYLGDFYPLTDETGAGDDVWCAWQCDRPDLKAGFAIVFRRGAAAGESRTFKLGGIEPNATYQIDCYDGSKKTVQRFRTEGLDGHTAAAVVPIGLLPETVNGYWPSVVQALPCRMFYRQLGRTPTMEKSTASFGRARRAPRPAIKGRCE